jgi:peptidoglycan/xylan/chitin deacetylase (PgdA/CDA1 family)
MEQGIEQGVDISGVTVPAPARRFVLASGGLTLIAGGFAQFGPKSQRSSTPVAGPPRPRGRQGGAPFPGQGTPRGSQTPSQTPVTVDPADLPNPADQYDPPPAPGKPQFYVHEGPKAIALTVDDGPDPRYTPKVLALLAQYNIKATFCMLGSSGHSHPGLVQEVAAAGHLIANHTYTHADLSRLTAAQIRSEITRAHDALTGAGAAEPRFFRAPYGSWSPAAFQVCHELGLRPLDWSVDPKDWSRPGTDHIVNTVLGSTHPGSIILEHDGGGDRSQTVAALTRFLPKLLDAGYTFVQP